MMRPIGFSATSTTLPVAPAVQTQRVQFTGGNCDYDSWLFRDYDVSRVLAEHLKTSVFPPDTPIMIVGDHHGYDALTMAVALNEAGVPVNQYPIRTSSLQTGFVNPLKRLRNHSIVGLNSDSNVAIQHFELTDTLNRYFRLKQAGTKNAPYYTEATLKKSISERIEFIPDSESVPSVFHSLFWSFPPEPKLRVVVLKYVSMYLSDWEREQTGKKLGESLSPGSVVYIGFSDLRYMRPILEANGFTNTTEAHPQLFVKQA